jgi:PAS domain S-box-containing protein
MTDRNEMSLESEQGFRTLFEHATIGILVVDQRGYIELANPTIENLFGYSAVELIGQPMEILIPKKSRKNHENHRSGYFQNPKTRPMGKGMELHGQKKDGNIFDTEVSLGYYKLRGESKAVAFVTDITERRMMEKELRRLNNQLDAEVKERTSELVNALDREKEMNELKSQFVSIASHEFRTPLSAVLSSAALIGRYIEADQIDKTQKHINRIKSSVKNLTEILNDFLSLDKLKKGKIQADFESIDLQELLRELVDSLDHVKKDGQEIILKYTGNPIALLDPKILRNIMLNLLSNAIKYSEEDIELKCQVIKNEIALSVHDKGIGIPKEDQKNLFSQFFRASNVSGIQGTGLGLNIVRRYVELMNGEISFSSSRENGTSFKIVFST